MIHTFRIVRPNTISSSKEILDPIFSIFFGKDWLNNTKITIDDNPSKYELLRQNSEEIPMEPNGIIIYDIECDTKLPLMAVIGESDKFTNISMFSFNRKYLNIRSDKPSRLSKAILRKLNGSTEDVKITPQ